MFVNPSLFRKGRHILLEQSSCTSPTIFHQLNVETLLAAKGRSIVVALKKSTILYRNAAWPGDQGSILRYFCISLVCEALRSGGRGIRGSGEIIMETTKEAFLKPASRIPETITDRNIAETSLWEVPSQYCAMPYVNGERYLTCDEPLKSKKIRYQRKNNDEFNQTWVSIQPHAFQSVYATSS